MVFTVVAVNGGGEAAVERFEGVDEARARYEARLRGETAGGNGEDGLLLVALCIGDDVVKGTLLR